MVIKAKLQVTGYRVRLRDVVEGHHDDAEEQHGRDGSDPIPVGREDAVLVGRTGPAEQLERTEVGGNEAQTRDPCGHLAAGQEELFAGVGGPLHVEADERDDEEVEDQDEDVDRRKVGQLLSEQDESERCEGHQAIL
jgi:hypothetical protein